MGHIAYFRDRFLAALLHFCSNLLRAKTFFAQDTIPFVSRMCLMHLAVHSSFTIDNFKRRLSKQACSQSAFLSGFFKVQISFKKVIY